MPMDRSRYPPNWPEISRRIRARAGNRCEWCGAENHQPHPVTGSRVVLTVAHLDDDPSNNADSNLAALCQRCHLTYDAPIHAAHARVTKRRKRDARRGQLPLLDITERKCTGRPARNDRRVALGRTVKPVIKCRREET